jgi:hypothetical protein
MPKRVEQSDVPAPPKGFSDYMKALGRKGGLASKAGRLEKLTPAKRRAIARKAAKARWAKRKAEAAE